MMLKDPKPLMIPGTSLTMCPVRGSEEPYLINYFPEKSVTTRKDWMTTTKRVVTIGESMTARIDGTQGQKGQQPSLHSL